MKPAICTQCGSQIEVDETRSSGFCPSCGTKFVTDQIIHNTVVQENIQNTYYVNQYGEQKFAGLKNAVDACMRTEGYAFAPGFDAAAFKRAVLSALVTDNRTPPDVIKESVFSEPAVTKRLYVQISGEAQYDWSAAIGFKGREGEIRYRPQQGTDTAPFSFMIAPGAADQKAALAAFKRYQSAYAAGLRPIANAPNAAPYVTDVRDIESECVRAAQARFRRECVGDGFKNLSGDMYYKHIKLVVYEVPEYRLTYTYGGANYTASSVAMQPELVLQKPVHTDKSAVRAPHHTLRLIIAIGLFVLGGILGIVGSSLQSEPISTVLTLLALLPIGGGAGLLIYNGVQKKKNATALYARNRQNKQADFDALYGR